MSEPTAVSDIRAQLEPALAALAAPWQPSNRGRLRLISGSKRARNALLRDLEAHPPKGAEIRYLAVDGLYMSLVMIARYELVDLEDFDPAAGFRRLAAQAARQGQQLILVCDDVERVAPMDLAYLCEGATTTVKGSSAERPGILLLLLGSHEGTRRRLTRAWVEAGPTWVIFSALD